MFHGGSAPPEIAVDSRNLPHVIACPPGEFRYTIREASVWSEELVTGTVGGGICGELALGPEDVPYASISIPPTWDPTHFYLGLKPRRTWEFVQRPASGGDLAVDSAGIPHMITAIRTSPTDWFVRYLSLLAGNWSEEEVESFLSSNPFLHPSWSSIVLDPVDGAAHALYYESARGDVRYAFRDASGWHVEVVDFAGSIGRFVRGGQLALRADGTPVAVYGTGLGPRDLRYAVRESSGWVSEVVDDTATFLINPTLALSAGVPCVAYVWVDEIDASRIIWDQDLIYRCRESGGWSRETIVDGFIDGPAGLARFPQFPDLKTDSCGQPHLAHYFSWTMGLADLGSGVYYATKGDPCESEPEPRVLKHDAIKRIRTLKVRALDRADERFVEALDDAERLAWKSLGYAEPFRPTKTTAGLRSDVFVRSNRGDRVDLAFGPSWAPRLPAYDSLRVTWANVDVTKIDLPDSWPLRPLRYDDEVWVDAWKQDLAIDSRRDWGTGKVILSVRVRDASLGFTLSLDADDVAALTFAYALRSWWIDESHLDPRQGHRVFQLERNAVDCLVTFSARDDGDDDEDDEGREVGIGALHGDDHRERNGCRYRDPNDDDDEDDDEYDDGKEGRSSDARTPRCRLTANRWTDAERAELDAECSAIAYLLVSADEGLARTALDDAKDTPVKDPRNQGRVDREIRRAEREFARAEETWVQLAFGKAIGHFEEAWRHAQRAIHFATR